MGVHCNSLETLARKPVNCAEINSFWAKIISWWNHQSGDGYLVDELSILYDYNPEDKETLISIISFSWERGTSLIRDSYREPRTLTRFLTLLKAKLIVHKCISQSKGHGINKFHSLINFLFVTGASSVIYLFIYLLSCFVVHCNTFYICNNVFEAKNKLHSLKLSEHMA